MRTALKKDEKLLLIIRHHWLKLVIPFFIWALVVTVVCFYATVSFSLLFLLLTSLYPLYIYFTWFHNIWAVTNFRVIDEGGFYTRYAKESPLDKINNIQYDQSFWGRIFGFGDVDIQTAAEMGETNYKMIHHPKLLKDTITHAQGEYKNIQISSQAQQLAKAIASQGISAQPAPQLVADELKKLFDLLQSGAITPMEYETQKAKLLRP
jgi:uncharacterized membrane protein YdbT with pleckstrin-like domain